MRSALLDVLVSCGKAVAPGTGVAGLSSPQQGALMGCMCVLGGFVEQLRVGGHVKVAIGDSSARY